LKWLLGQVRIQCRRKSCRCRDIADVAAIMGISDDLACVHHKRSGKLCFFAFAFSMAETLNDGFDGGNGAGRVKVFYDTTGCNLILLKG